MSKSSMTVRDVFELPEPGADGSEGWKTFEDKVSNEVKGIKTAALPDVAEKVAELFEIPIPDIFLTTWKKANGIQALLDESRSEPETVMNTELGEHTINSQHRPHIEIRIQNKAVKKLEFTLKLVFNLKGFVLKIQDGAIRGMQTGLCEVKGKLEYQGLVIAEKKLSPITLPGSVSFGGTTVEPLEETAEEKSTSTTAPETEDASKTVEALAAPPEELKSPESIKSETPDASEEIERTTWEVGELEEAAGAKQESVARDIPSEASQSVETTQDMIARMSRELADRRQSSREASDTADRAKAAS